MVTDRRIIGGWIDVGIRDEKGCQVNPAGCGKFAPFPEPVGFPGVQGVNFAKVFF